MQINNRILAALSLAIFVIPVVASAQNTTDAQLQEQVQFLLAEIRSLEQQVAATQSGSTTTLTWCHAFNTNLEIGSTGTEVTALQQALAKDGETVGVSGTFDEQTAFAVTGFQQKYASQVLAPSGLQNGTGYVGKATRAKLNSLFNCNSSTPIVPPIVVNPTAPTTTPPVACPAWGCGPAPVIGPFPTPTPTQTPSFSVSQTSVNSGGSLTFSWNVPTASTFTQPTFTVNPCPAGITMYDVTNGKTFLCGDLGRTVSWSGSDTIQFMNTSTNPVQMYGQLDFGASQPLQRDFSVEAGSFAI